MHHEDFSTYPSLLKGIPLGQIQAPQPSLSAAIARLHANELSEPWPDEVIEAIGEIVKLEPINRYLESEANQLRQIIADNYGVEADQVVLGAGSLELIGLVARVLAGVSDASSRRILVPEPTFPVYAQIGRMNNINVITIPLREDFHLDESAMQSALDEGIGVCFLARPNNPTGTLWASESIRRFIDAYPSTVFVVDEVYLPYARTPSLWSSNAPVNLICISSLSKVGLAGERLGYGITHPGIAAHLKAQQLPFSVSRSAIAIGGLILTRFRVAQQTLIDRVIANRDLLIRVLKGLPGAVVFPSSANMVLARLPSADYARNIRASLERRGILIHGFPRGSVLENSVRVTVGTSHEINLLGQAVDSWVSEIQPHA